LAARGPRFSNSVFLNCPFDRGYWGLFEAMVFCVVDCGFVPRCGLEAPDGGVPRLQRLESMIAGSQYSIHDLSRVELTPLPRSNMPFELGLELGCRAFGGDRQRRKRCLILDAEPYRYQETLSDIAGQDIRAHGNSAENLITTVRNWLRASSKRTISGPRKIQERFALFSKALPTLCSQAGLHRDELEFRDYLTLVEEWERPAA
jgi:hypothetical protein